MFHRGDYVTNAGMHCVWDTAAFADIKDYDSWAKSLLEDADIKRQIEAGHFVPLNIGSDGAMAIEIRVGTNEAPAELSERETQYLIVASQPYRLQSKGKISLSGIEGVSGEPDAHAVLPLAAGQYSARAHLIAWDEEPGMQTPDGPASDALPDYIVLINPAAQGQPFRTELGTFK
ncbi:hypothetical protein Pan44_47460 [Caulifigura coniformis]|uniref:Uncharacterized protein n=1 Tax=Caulifigura coniformis TaxID=2527983 RepID=A0A517SKN4_9PLAN|nr:hypothetical protein [Caulifigura coniformis]QDT56689.1 hypothetical protein Pan44_47460 [Caulifigura coniformis]